MRQTMTRLFVAVVMLASPLVAAQNRLDDESGRRIGQNLKVRIAEKEKNWKLVNDAVRELEWRNANDAKQFVRIEIRPYGSVEEARSEFLKAKDGNAMLRGEKYEGLGEEAWMFRSPYGNGGIIFRIKKTIVSIYASQLVDAIGMGQHAVEATK
jgi:hypothetical protein